MDDARVLPLMSLPPVKIFVSSPGDVGEERLVARQVVDRLQGQFGGFLRLEPILWEWEPILARADRISGKRP